ncbi:MAG: YfcE family phosphodiesterase [Pseudomonadota bacterium]
MLIGVMSDTHGNLNYMQRAAYLMVYEFGVEAIIHLGDDYADAIKMDTHGRVLFAVPGMFEKAWNDKNIPHRLIKEFGGIVFMLSHTPARDKHDKGGDINPARALSDYGADVLLHGHTHIHRLIGSEDGLILICPGQLKAEKDRGFPAGFAIIDAKRPNLYVRFVDLYGKVLEEQHARVKHADEFDAMDETIKEEISSDETSV